MADTIKPIAPNNGIPFTKGGIWATTNMEEPMDRADRVTPHTPLKPSQGRAGGAGAAIR